MSSTRVLCRGKRETHKTLALTDNMKNEAQKGFEALQGGIADYKKAMAEFLKNK